MWSKWHQSYIFQASGLNLRIQVGPFQYLVPGHTCEGEHVTSLSAVSHTFILNCLRWVAPENDHLCPVALEHDGRK